MGPAFSLFPTRCSDLGRIRPRALPRPGHLHSPPVDDAASLGPSAASMVWKHGVRAGIGEGDTSSISAVALRKSAAEAGRRMEDICVGDGAGECEERKPRARGGSTVTPMQPVANK